jgi:hypothetical protein
MATFPAPNRGLQPDVVAPAPRTSSDIKAAKLLSRDAKQMTNVSHVSDTNGATAGPISGTKVSGGARISGGKG